MFVALANLPVRQVPVLRRGWDDSKPQNLASYLMQATGRVVSPDRTCERCRKRNGVYDGACVVAGDPEIVAHTNNACANCWYGRNGFKCTLRSSNPGKGIANVFFVFIFNFFLTKMLSDFCFF